MKIRACGISELGRVRKNNEDNFLMNSFYKDDLDQKKVQKDDNDQRKQYLYAVCDGMGGEQYGEQASWLAVKALAEFVSKPFNELIDQYITQANQAICKFSAAQGGVHSGTTAAILYLKDNLAHIYNIGDSRIYLWRDNSLKLLTVDHSKAWQMAEIGILDFETAEKHPSRHILTQHLGLDPAEAVINVHKVPSFPVQKKDLFLLCSDGLNDMLDQEEIAAILQKSDSVQTKTQALIQAALDKGGKDNVTVILAEVEDTEGIRPTSVKIVPKRAGRNGKKLSLILGMLVLVLQAGAVSWKLGWWEQNLVEEPNLSPEPPAYALELYTETGEAFA
ncbi:MAG: protein phosphatase 2C domain-containing protein, partial [Clostridia bacterium]|nr:protein phosphatase 2C domain-containing protein [Clostridia bacterium]